MDRPLQYVARRYIARRPPPHLEVGERVAQRGREEEDQLVPVGRDHGVAPVARGVVDQRADDPAEQQPALLGRVRDAVARHDARVRRLIDALRRRGGARTTRWTNR